MCQGQADLLKFQASLLYLECSRPARATVRLHFKTKHTYSPKTLEKLLLRMLFLECERARLGFRTEVSIYTTENGLQRPQQYKVLGYEACHVLVGLGVAGKVGAWRKGLQKPSCWNCI